MSEGVSYRGRLRQRAQRKSYAARDSDFDDSEEKEQVVGEDSGSDDDFQAASAEEVASVADEDFNEGDDYQESIEDDFSENGSIEDGIYEGKRKASRASGTSGTPSKRKVARTSTKTRSKPSDISVEYDTADSDKNRFTMVYGTNADTIEAAILMADIFRADISAPRHSHLSHSLFFKPWIEQQEEQESTFEREKGQVIRDLAMNDPTCEKYFPGSNKNIVSLLLGPLHGNEGQKTQKLFKLSRFAFVSLNAPNVFPEKRGFIMNVGDCVTALEWATRKPEGDQYLAIATSPKGLEIERTPNVPSGFARCRQPASLQIWQFSATEPAPALPKVSLHLVLAFDWGTIVDMQWQPGTFPTSIEDIGLLIAVFEDGSARVIRVKSRQRNRSPICKFETPLFEIRLSDTIITACSWVGHHKVILGCANGMVALYDLNVIRPDSVHIPVMYYPVHHTYISRIVHMAPSMPNHIATVGADGNFTFHDMRDPQSSKLMSQQKFHRTVDSAGLVWHDRTLSLIYTDGTKFNSIYPVRRLGRRMKIIEGTTEALAGSTGGGGSHPFIASGTSDGKVLLVNPHQKVAPTNRDTSKLKLYEQTWFTIEYSRKSAIYRMQDEFRLEQKSTLFEMSENFYLPEVYIRKVCWNPNKAYGSWCAAGTGGGLVRVENVALDVNESLDPSKEVQEAEAFREKLHDAYKEHQLSSGNKPDNPQGLTDPDTIDTNEKQRATIENGKLPNHNESLESDINKSQLDPISEVQKKIVNQLRNLHSPTLFSSHTTAENHMDKQQQQYQQVINLESKQPTNQQQYQAVGSQEELQGSGADGT